MENLTNKEITDLLPHRPPFLFIDKIISIDGNRRIIASKRIQGDEDYFKGHFPGKPLVPGVLIVESMAQTAGIIAACESNPDIALGESLDLYFLTRIENMKFRYPVYPGDTLIIKAEVLMRFGGSVKSCVEGQVKGKVVAEGELVLSKQKEV